MRRTAWIVSTLVALLCAADVFGQSWTQRSYAFKSRHYQVRTDLERADAEALANHMDITCDAYWRMFQGLRVRRQPTLTLLLFAKQQDYLDVLQQRYGVNGAGSWGMCINRGSEIALVGFRGGASLEQMETLLQHEGFHQFAATLFPDIPIWANEGLAEVFGKGVVFGNELILGETSPSAVRLLWQADRSRSFVPFERFFAIEGHEWGTHVQSGTASLNYQQAWAVCHFFLYANNGSLRDEFLGFLGRMNQGSGWEAAFRHSFGHRDYESLQTAWLQYVMAMKPTDYRGVIRRLEFLARGQLELRERDRSPHTLDALRNDLREASFSFDSNLFGAAVTMESSDDRWYLPPPFGVNLEPPGVFRLVDGRGRTPKPLKPGQKVNERQPPHAIVTSGLTPRNLGVSWKRVQGEWIFELQAQ